VVDPSNFDPSPLGLMRRIGLSLEKTVRDMEVDDPAMDPGEELLWSQGSSRRQSRFRTVGGRLYLTNRRLVFAPHKMDARHGGHEWDVALSDVAGFRVAGRMKWVEADLRDGSIERFALRPADETVASLNARLAAARNL
jgi:hypothetical protein